MKFLSPWLSRWLGQGLVLGLTGWSTLAWADEPTSPSPTSDNATAVSEEVGAEPDLLSRPLQSRPTFSLPNLADANLKLHTCPTYAQLRDEVVDVLKRNGVKSAEYYLPSFNELSPSLAEDDDYIPLVEQTKLSHRYVQIGPNFILKFSFIPRRYLPVTSENQAKPEASKDTVGSAETKASEANGKTEPSPDANKTADPTKPTTGEAEKTESKVLDTKKLEQALSQVKKQVTQKFSEAGLTKAADPKAKALATVPVKPAELAGQDDCLARVMVQFVKDPSLVSNQRLMQTLNYIYPLYGLSLASVTSNKEAETIGSQLILAQAVKNNQVNHYTVTEKGEKLGAQANFSSQEFIWGQYKLISAVSSEFDVFVVENWGALWNIADPKAKEFALPSKAEDSTKSTGEKTTQESKDSKDSKETKSPDTGDNKATNEDQDRTASEDKSS